MNPHKNARLTPYSRELRIARIRKRGWIVAKARSGERFRKNRAINDPAALNEVLQRFSVAALEG